MKKIILLILSIAMLGVVGCSSNTESKEEVVKGEEFAITDGEIYKDIETLENGREYVVPIGKWEVTKVEDDDLGLGKIDISSSKNGNSTINYEKSFELEVSKDEKVTIMMSGEGMQLFFKEITD